MTTADVGPRQGADEVSVRAVVELELGHGVRVRLLGDRGWASTGRWAGVSPDDVRRTTLVTVGPDEPFGDRSPDDMARDHWAALAREAGRHGVAISAEELAALPHDVVLAPRLRERLGTPAT